MKDKAHIKITMESSQGETVVLEGRGALVVVPRAFNNSDHLTVISQAVYGEISPSDVARKILTMIDDKNEDQSGDFWRSVVADVINGLFVTEIGESTDTITGRISEADAFAMDAMDKTGKERQA